MAVVQISRIQIRRGKANAGTGFPQLASGEMGWAVDTQELYIGNGAVSEGAPAVGNTKILTQNDLNIDGNLLQHLVHIYKVADANVLTGENPGTPTTRFMQDKLDDVVYVADFGAVGDGAVDDTVAIQRAIDQLFLNSNGKSSIQSEYTSMTRVNLVFAPGTYRVTNTLYIPSYATIVGAGSDKTKITHYGNEPAIIFVNDNSSIGNPNIQITTTLYNTQPRHITMKGLSVTIDTTTQTALKFDAVRNSNFEDLYIIGSSGSSSSSNSRGISLNALSSIVTCQDNIFRNIRISGFKYAVYSKQDILNNVFEDCYITDARYGFILGGDQDNIDENPANGATVGEQYGPRETKIIRAKFDNVRRQAVYVYRGTANTFRDCNLSNVGANGGGLSQSAYPQFFINTPGNLIEGLNSDRNDPLVTTGLGSPLATVPYIPEVAGAVTFSLYGTNNTSLGQATNSTAFRLPVSTDRVAVPTGSVTHTVKYTYHSFPGQFTRSGVLTVVADITASTALSTSIISVTDDYTIAGNLSLANQLKLSFTASFLNGAGTAYNGTVGTVPQTILVKYTNSLSGDSGSFSYSYTSNFN